MRFPVGACGVLLAVAAASARASDGTTEPLPEYAASRLGTLRLRHRGAVTGVAFAAGGARVISIAGEPFARVWDTETGLETARIGVGEIPLTAVAVSRDDRTLAAGRDGSVSLWTLDVGDGTATAAGSFGGDGVGEDGAASRVTALAFGADASRLAVGRDDGAVWVAAAGKVERTLRRHTAPVTSLGFSADGGALATASADTTVRLWNPDDGKHLLSMVGHAHGVVGAGFAAGDEHVASAGEDGTLRIFGRATGVERGQARGVGGSADTYAISPDGTLAAIGHRDGTISLWRVEGLEEVGRLAGHRGAVRALAFRRDGRMLASGAEDRTVRLWDVDTRRELARGRPSAGPPARGSGVAALDAPAVRDRVEAVAFAPDSRTVLTAAWDRTLRVWDGESGRRLRRFPGPARTGTAVLLRVAFGARGDPVELWREGHRCYLREATTGARVIEHNLQRADTAVDLAPDLTRLVVGSRDGSIRAWNVLLGSETVSARVSDVEIACLATGGAHVAVVDANARARVWSRPADVILGVDPGLDGAIPNAIALSRDAAWLAVAGPGRSVRLFDVRSAKLVRTFEGHEDEVRCLGFSPDGKRLASGADDGTVVVWRLPE